MKHFVSRFGASCLLLSSVAMVALPASAKDLKSVGVTVVDLGNPFFGAIAKSIEAKVKAAAPGAKTLVVSGDYDLGKQSTQFDNFIQAGVDLIVVSAVDSKAIGAAVKRAEAAGIKMSLPRLPCRGRVVAFSSIEHTCVTSNYPKTPFPQDLRQL